LVVFAASFGLIVRGGAAPSASSPAAAAPNQVLAEVTLPEQTPGAGETLLRILAPERRPDVRTRSSD
jgi:hypothetical protein